MIFKSIDYIVSQGRDSLVLRMFQSAFVNQEALISSHITPILYYLIKEVCHSRHFSFAKIAHSLHQPDESLILNDTSLAKNLLSYLFNSQLRKILKSKVWTFVFKH